MAQGLAQGESASYQSVQGTFGEAAVSESKGCVAQRRGIDDTAADLVALAMEKLQAEAEAARDTRQAASEAGPGGDDDDGAGSRRQHQHRSALDEGRIEAVESHDDGGQGRQGDGGLQRAGHDASKSAAPRLLRVPTCLGMLHGADRRAGARTGQHWARRVSSGLSTRRSQPGASASRRPSSHA